MTGKAPLSDLALFLQSWLNRWPAPARDLWHDLALGRLPSVRYRLSGGRQFAGGSWPAWCYLPNGLVRHWIRRRGDLERSFFRDLTERYDGYLKGEQMGFVPMLAALLCRWRRCWRWNRRSIQAEVGPAVVLHRVRCLLPPPSRSGGRGNRGSFCSWRRNSIEIEQVAEKTTLFLMAMMLLVRVGPPLLRVITGLGGWRNDRSFTLRRAGWHGSEGTLDQLVELATIQPDAAALRTVVDFNALPFRHDQIRIRTDGTFHGVYLMG